MAARDPNFVPVSLEPDSVIEAYKKDIDRTLIRENLKLTPAQRLDKLQAFMEPSTSCAAPPRARRRARHGSRSARRARSDRGRAHARRRPALSHQPLAISH